MDNDALSAFVDSVCNDSHLRVEEDLGDGFVRLRTEEAQRRQAAQDIRCSEDVVIEMLRNSRDAGARCIFLATATEGQKRTIVVIDDGEGIPESVHARIFEPCVTSKLDTVHMDKWGIHGRGMALYSIMENTQLAEVCASQPGRGACLRVVTDTSALGEKADQSTFPVLSFNEAGRVVMRGPKNILRTACEFSLEHRKSISVYVGSIAEMVSTLYHFALSSLPASTLLRDGAESSLPYTKSLALAADAAELTCKAAAIGLTISDRTSYRIMEGKIKPLDSLMELMEQQGVEGAPQAAQNHSRKPRKTGASPAIASQDRDQLADDVKQVFSKIASRYYFHSGVEPRITVEKGALHISIPLIDIDE